jgi:hypothetical protein
LEIVLFVLGFCFLSHLQHVARVTPPNFIGGNFVPWFCGAKRDARFFSLLDLFFFCYDLEILLSFFSLGMDLDSKSSTLVSIFISFSFLFHFFFLWFRNTTNVLFLFFFKDNGPELKTLVSIFFLFYFCFFFLFKNTIKVPFSFFFRNVFS